MNSEFSFDPVLELSPDRHAILAPKLQRLLLDFARLQELESPEVEPVSSDWLVRSVGRDR